MPNLAIAFWRVNSERIPNDTPQLKLAALHTHIAMAFQAITNVGFHVFMVPEFFFMNANRGENDVRWYTKAERDLVIKGLKAQSRRFQRLLLVGGTVCWAKTSGGIGKRTQWKVANEAPVCYAGALLKLHRKRSWGGETLADDALRLYEARKGNVDRQFFVRGDDASDGTPVYATQLDNRPLSVVASYVGQTNRRGAVAPGIQAAHDKYMPRIHYEQGTGEGSFAIPGGNFTGGVEICQEHNGTATQGTLQTTSSLGTTNFHLLTSNSVSHRPGHENLADPGYFLHCDTAGGPLVICRQGATLQAVPASQWTHLTPELCRLELPVPAGL